MGGVKNRDEKRKKAHVYSSGGGGGTKGPSVIDKRNQELNCPHCDKIFKQKGRLQEHIKSKHADQESNGTSSQPQDSGQASTSSSTSNQHTMMDVGSKSGYYTKKSPKMFLSEWCQKEKRPKPRYKVVPRENGKFGCKVVLPDERNNDKDIVVFLPELMYCNEEMEAQMTAAVFALARVAGDRQMERVLPKQFLWVWESAKKIFREKEEIKQRKEKSKAESVERKKQKEQALKARTPKVVTMSQDKQRMLEGLVRNAQSTSSFATSMEEDEIDQENLSKFQQMGFQYDDVLDAYNACGGGQADFEVVLDWMCVNIDEDRLPKKYRSDGKSRAVCVVRTSKDDNAIIEDPFVKELMNFGYEQEQCQAALQNHAGDLSQALMYLFAKENGLEEPGTIESSLESQEEWAQECEALQAIYEERVQMVDENCVQINIDIESPEQFFPDWVIIPPEMQDQLDLKIVIRQIGEYPNQFPFLGVYSGSLPATLLRQTTQMLIEFVESEELLGTPMIYELVARLSEGLTDLQPETSENDSQNDDEVESQSNPDEVEIANIRLNLPQSSRAGEKNGKKRSLEEIQKQSDKLYKNWLDYQSTSKLQEIKLQRSHLPASSYHQQVISSIDKHRVVVIRGATGCGKTTQIPQFILDHFASQKRGGECSIVCTQPRRISAIGVAQRVAEERGEFVGQTVGYHVRLDNKFNDLTRLLFCTTGIMLRRLLGDPELRSFTHIVVDEVHERSVESDLLLLLLRKILFLNTEIKVVLMSATADAELFQQYFGNICEVNVVSIPGFTYPVRDFYLEDVIEMTGFQVGKRSKWAKSQRNKDEDDQQGQDGSIDEDQTNVGALDKQYSDKTISTLNWVDETLVNYELIERLVCALIQRGQREGSLAFLSDWKELTQDQLKDSKDQNNNGAILVFLPGMEEINKTMRQLQQSGRLQELVGRNGLQILPLHGSLPPQQQSRVFHTPPKGCKKIVLATNIAETSITIPDITCVIDCGRVREVAYDFYKGLKVMKTVWVAQAQAKQRRGRAGRVRPGVCFKLFSQRTWSSMSEYPAPEILHTALEPLILQVKTMQFFSGEDVLDIFMDALTPPGKPALEHAIERLVAMQAVDEKQQLTPLGLHLSRLPVDPPVGKMLIFGVLLGCLDPILTIAAAISYGKPLFMNALDRREEVDGARRQLLRNCVEMRSDHLAYVTIFNTWDKLSGSARRELCDQYMVSYQVLEGMQALRKDYLRMLEDLELLSNQMNFDNRNSDNARFVKSAVCAGFYPNILRVQHPEAKFKKVAGGSIQVDNNPKDLKFYEKVKGRTFIHPQSVNFHAGSYQSGWCVYTDIIETTKVYVREASMVPIYSLLLFGGQITVKHDSGLLLLDNWATFKAPAKIAVLVKQLREQVHQLLQQKIKDPGLQFDGNQVITAMMELLRSDGF